MAVSWDGSPQATAFPTALASQGEGRASVPPMLTYFQPEISAAHVYCSKALSLELAVRCRTNVHIVFKSMTGGAAIDGDTCIRDLLTQGVPGVPQDPFSPRRGPLDSSPYREAAIRNAHTLVPGPLARP